ncbi:tetratricopeptide repeat protein [Streptomyces sp. NPDC049577]|uniref:tetratricopeptide repeat protein n=1 Tax=Streptomyces sp. NPDC049577 TaxID=3155153 RepID=UPI00342E35B8
MSGGDHAELSGTFTGPVLGTGVQHISYGVARGPAPRALAALPPAPGLLVGREEQVAELLASLDPGATGSPTTVVSAVAGLAGVGKTSLVLHAAHEAVARGWFPGGVLFVDLRGYDPGGPLGTAEALGSLLRAVGVREADLPPGEAEQAALLRSQLAEMAAAGRPVLLVADNASGAAQVEPLLPGSPAHRVLVTSRHTLASLPRARLLDLDILTPAGAAELIARSLTEARPGDPRPDEEPSALARLAELCGLLPLALRIAAALLKADPYRSLEDLADELTESHSRLAALHYDDDGGAPGVRAAFDLSYARLDERQARLFRLLPLNPGADIATEAAAALAGEPVRPVRALLAALARAHLLEPVGRDRWRMHDLVREYARELGLRQQDRREALGRLLDHYVAWAEDAQCFTRPVPGKPRNGHLTEHSRALAWIERERATLVAATTLAATSGRPRQALTLAHLLHPFLHRHRYREDLVTTARAYLKAAHITGDEPTVTHALYALGTALNEAERWDEAVGRLKGATALAQRAGDRITESRVLRSIGQAHSRAGRHEEAARHFAHALAVARTAGDRKGEAAAVTCLGTGAYDRQHYEEAIARFEEAEALMAEAGVHDHGTNLANLFRALFKAGRLDEGVVRCREAAARMRSEGDRLSEVRLLTEAGMKLHQAGRLGDAVTYLREAVAAGEEYGHWGFLGDALSCLGQALLANGETAAGRDCLERAATLFEAHEAGDPAQAIRTLLSQLSIA